MQIQHPLHSRFELGHILPILPNDRPFDIILLIHLAVPGDPSYFSRRGLHDDRSVRVGLGQVFREYFGETERELVRRFVWPSVSLVHDDVPIIVQDDVLELDVNRDLFFSFPILDWLRPQDSRSNPSPPH